MPKRVAVPLVCVLIVAVAGCASSRKSASSTSTAPPSAAVSTPDVSGMWTGAEVGGPTVSMMLKQTGTNVTGNLDIAGRPDISGPVAGRLEGNTLKLEERSGYGSEPFLRVNGDQITGIVAGTTLNLRRTR